MNKKVVNTVVVIVILLLTDPVDGGGFDIGDGGEI